jgi:hypothetical protein
MGKFIDTGWFILFYCVVFCYLPDPGGKKAEAVGSICIEVSYYLKNKLSYHFLLLLAGLILSFHIHAQVYTDTTEVANDTGSGAEGADLPVDETTPYYPDTLKRQLRSIVDDSVQAINADKGFYYKTYMDSLLRATENRIKKILELRRKDSLRADSLLRVGKSRSGRGLELDGGQFFNSAIGIIFLIIAIALFVYIVFKLFLSNSSFFSRNRKNIASDSAVVEEENAGDPDSLLHNAIKSGNYRLAVRYLYLQSLKRLSERKFIEINTNKTNYEYVAEIRKHKFANEFASLTLQYEYVWYGEYPVDEKLFEQIQNGFTQFTKNNLR